ncbi:RepB family plasmid replication initiator protein [Enterococcus casseliflavus]|nr:RepB family plasmid replication initiator protein [Enterococcus casseliflavus]
MVLENKLGLTNSAELAKQEELLTKTRAKELFESGKLDELEIGTFQGLSDIHQFLFQDIYDFAGKIREVNIAKGNFQFAPRIFLAQTLEYIDKLPQETFDEIIDKYSDMNVAHSFREGNSRATRIWLDLMLKSKLHKFVDWNQIDKDEYLNAMIRSTVSTNELKYLIQQVLTDDLGKEQFFKGIDASYYYKGGRREEQVEAYRKPSISIRELREMTDTVIEYKRFTHFETRVLKEPLEEINEHTSFNVTYDKIKKGRSIDSIVFHIEKKRQADDTSYKLEDKAYQADKKAKEETEEKLVYQAMKSKYTQVLLENMLLSPYEMTDTKFD